VIQEIPNPLPEDLSRAGLGANGVDSNRQHAVKYLIMNFLRRNELFVFCLALMAISAGVSPSAAKDDSYSRLPYQFHQVKQIPGARAQSFNPWSSKSLICRVPGQEADGVLYTWDRGPRLLIYLAGSYREDWMEPYPMEFNGEDNPSGVDGVWTFHQGGEPEAVFHAFSPNRFRLLVERHRVRDGKLTARFELDTGPDLNGDGVWDGEVRVAGLLNVPTPAGPQKALVILAMAAYDLSPRGVRAVAADTGELLWNYLVGPKPGYDDFAMADLDGDHEPEIIFGGEAVGNIHQGDFNGTRDDSTRVFVLDRSGHLLWSRPFAPYPATLNLRVADVRGDSLPEILVGSGSSARECNGLFLLDGKGSLLDSLAVPSGVGEIAVIPGEENKEKILLQDGTFAWMRVDCGPGLSVVADRSFSSKTLLAGIEDLVPEPGFEILLGGDRDAPTWLVSQSLEPLARFPEGTLAIAPGGFRFFHAGGDTVFPAVRGPAGTWSFALEKSPRPIPWGLMGGILPPGWPRRR